jgi:predicted Zn-dependent peptidase
VSPASLAAARREARDRTLPNGLRVVIEPRPGVPGAAVELAVPVGAARDPSELPGATALLWEWQDRGAGGRGLRARRDAFARLGVRQGGGAGRSHSGVSATMLADALPEALMLLAAELTGPHLDDAEFARARHHALEALAALDDRPAERLDVELTARTLAGPHGRSVYGRAEALRSATPEAIRAHRARTVGPAGAVLLIVGGVDPDDAWTHANAAFGGWTGAVAPAAEPPRWAPPQRHDLPGEAEQTQLGWAWPLLPADDPRAPALALGLAVLASGSDARLFREVREARGLAYAVEAGSRAVPGAAWGTAHLATTPDRAEEAARVAGEELRRLADGVSAGELERARALLRTREAARAETGAGRAGQLLRDVLLRGAPRSVEERLEALARPTRDEVNAALAQAPCDAPTLVALGPAA